MILLSASPHAPKKGRSSAKPLGLNLAKGEMGYFNSSRSHILLFKVLFTENSFFDHSYTGRHSVECAEHKVSFSYTCPALWSCSKILHETACISAFIQLFPMRKSWNFLFALSLIHSNLTFLGSLVKPSLSSPLSVWRSSGEQDRTSAWEMRLPHCMQKEELLYSQAKLLGSEGGSFFLC